MEEEREWIDWSIDEYFDEKHLAPFVVSENFKYTVSSTVDKLLKIFDKRDTCDGEDFTGIDDE